MTTCRSTSGRWARSAVASEPPSENCVVSGSPVWLLAVMFLGAGAAIWAGIRLSEQTDVLTMRLAFGSALGGLILLAIATNLPEIAIVAAAAVSDNRGVGAGLHHRRIARPPGKRHGCKPFSGGSVPRRPLTRVKCAAG
jgi:hypothetical protein